MAPPPLLGALLCPSAAHVPSAASAARPRPNASAFSSVASPCGAYSGQMKYLCLGRCEHPSVANTPAHEDDGAVGRSRSLGLTDDELELVFSSGCLPSTFLVEVACACCSQWRRVVLTTTTCLKFDGLHDAEPTFPGDRKISCKTNLKFAKNAKREETAAGAATDAGPAGHAAAAVCCCCCGSATVTWRATRAQCLRRAATAQQGSQLGQLA